MSARPILPHEKRTKEWKDAIQTHAKKLIDLQFATKAQADAPVSPVRSFFVGRNVDGSLNARLVANGGLSIDGQALDQYLPTTAERFVFLTLFTTSIAAGSVPWSGDISGAYYATKGSGFIRLPHDWPRGTGGFIPNEVVSLSCAIPGDKHSSGLFLKQLDELLVSEGCEVVRGRIKRFKHACGRYSYFLNYSDDLIGFSPSKELMHEIELKINKRFKVSLTDQVPPKWVGMDLQLEGTALQVSSASTFLSYDLPYVRFTLGSLDQLNLEHKSQDDDAKKQGLSMIGKL